ncbi:SRPBCC family protein [Nakamurella sp. GG22]
MKDLADHLAAIHRSVEHRTTGDDQTAADTYCVTLRQRYDADPEDVWSALTDPDRLRRWFMPLTGDLRVGGSFQLEGNAGGDILTCEPPALLRVTFGAPNSIVSVFLVAEGDQTELLLEHSVPAEMAGSGAGAFYVGPGWDGALMALARFTDGEAIDDPVAAASSPEAEEFSLGSIVAWVSAVTESGTATAEQIEDGRQMALAQFAPSHLEQQHTGS